MARWTKKAREEKRKKTLDVVESDSAVLPMRHKCDLGKLGLKEWDEWQERQARYREIKPDYDNKFNRPTRDTTEKIWALLKEYGFLEEKIQPTRYLFMEEEDHSQRQLAARQAVVVALDTFVAAGWSHRQITHLKMFDALCRRFSDNYINLKCRVESVRDVLPITVKRCRRDLMLAGIRSKLLWEALTNWENPIFQVIRTGMKGVSKRVVFNNDSKGSPLDRFNEIMDADPQYVRAQRSGIRILFASDDPPENRRARYKICAEHPYNVVRLGPKSLNVLAQQEKVLLYLDVDEFIKDYDEAGETKKRNFDILRTQYHVEADLSNIPKTESRLEGGPPSKPWWPERAEYVYFRSIELGILEKRYEQVEFTRDDHENYRKLERCRAHIKNLPEWLKEYGMEGSGAQVVEWLRRNKEERTSSLTPEEVFFTVDKAMRNWRDKVRTLLEEYDAAVLHQVVFRNVAEQVRGLTGLHAIHSGFRRVLTRRYQPLHFWPTYVTSKIYVPTKSKESTHHGGDETPRNPPAEQVLESYREKWFKVKDGETGEVCSLAGYDISSSQMQIIAVFLGDDKLEEATTAPMGKPSFKQQMARWAWQLHKDERKEKLKLRDGYGAIGSYKVGDPDKDNIDENIDERLQELVKELLMRVSYGSNWWKVEMDQRCHPKTYGPGWESGSAGEFIKEFNEKYPAPQLFREICKRVAWNAYNKDPFRGFVLQDPFDKQEVRWNPVARAEVRVTGNEGFRISPPSGVQVKPGSVLAHALREALERDLIAVKANADGEYPIDRGELERMLAPCLVHLLDAYYSSLVMEALASEGITVFVGIHDCWLVPENQTDVLKKVMEEAAKKWYLGLEPIYEILLNYLDRNRKYKPLVEAAYSKWKRRKDDENWKLVFRAKEVRPKARGKTSRAGNLKPALEGVGERADAAAGLDSPLKVFW